MLYRISVTERGLTGIANIFRSRLSRLDDLLGAGTVPLIDIFGAVFSVYMKVYVWGDKHPSHSFLDGAKTVAGIAFRNIFRNFVKRKIDLRSPCLITIL